MAEFRFKMPDIGEGVVEAEITAWHISVGDAVSEDDPLADAMTDKATIELTAPVSGRAVRLGCAEGDRIAVGADLVVFEGVQGSDTDLPPATRPESPAAKRSDPIPKTRSAPSSGKVLASPAVRKRARDAGIDLGQVNPTGHAGNITRDDLLNFEKALEPEPGETRIKIIGLRRIIAGRMQASKRHIPHFTYVEEIDVTELEHLRKRLNTEKSADKPGLTVLPFIIRAVISAIRSGWPQMNAHYLDERGYLSQFEPVHLGIATQTDQGLMVPVVRNAQSLGIRDTAGEIARLARGARNNTLKREELKGATTTLTSLGPLGGIVTTPVINRPEVAIFGPNRIRPKLELRDGGLVERLVMNFSISCDHRIIDGYDAATMAQYIKGLLEDPLSMFL
ncbi:MAG: 2-oxo acid dehydrogenase subunit E2 [Hyphomonadaceae bacterium]|nr:2-oxo acid dehydrogenase subunit E2 [Hyphomonadaceae bacterium]MBC6413148.1 2-oxo acid dehydrogenase subunit E2 [Hyphomonadaceae bacterium]